jgi:hypothetical protein
MGRQEGTQQLVNVDPGRGALELGQVGEGDQQQEDEGNRGQQRVEGERAGQERDVVLVGGLEGAADESLD